MKSLSAREQWYIPLPRVQHPGFVDLGVIGVFAFPRNCRMPPNQ